MRVGPPISFWLQAEAAPERLALVAPDGSRSSAGALLARCNRLAHCRDHLAGYKCPRTIAFQDMLPRDANGKLYKRRLGDPYWVGRERRI